MSTLPTPPRWATRFLNWYCKAEIVEDLEGDLSEYYIKNFRKYGKRRADLIYVIDILKFLRPYTLRAFHLESFFTRFFMIKSYFRTSSRVLVRNPLFTVINIVGLAISMSIGLILIAMLMDLTKYDKHHEGYADIYRINSTYQYENNPAALMATTSLKASMVTSKELSASESVGVLYKKFVRDFSVQNKTVPLSGFFSNSGFLEVFTFNFVEGDGRQQLEAPFTAIITESARQKLFGKQTGVGKIIRHQDRDYVITGVMDNLPFFSHFNFEVLLSLSSQEILKEDPAKDEWVSVWDTWAYVRLVPGTPENRLNDFLHRLSERENKLSGKSKVTLESQALGDIMLSDRIGNQTGPVVGTTLPWMLTVLVIIVTSSAFFNYTNLSIARTIRRVREIGTRKVFGARRVDIMFQFIAEGILVAMCAFFLGLVGFSLLKPYFLTIEPEIAAMFQLEVSAELIGSFLVFAMFVGFVAGFFPSLFFSRKGILETLKSKGIAAAGKFDLSKGLMLLQFSLSIILVSACIGVLHQYHHFLNFDLGYRTARVYNLELQGNNAEQLMTEISKFPEVDDVSRSAVVTSLGNFWGTKVAYANAPDAPVDVALNIVDENYLALHKFRLLAGRQFDKKTGDAPHDEIIVNRSLITRLEVGKKTPESAIGEIILYENQSLRIVGVVEDFYYGRANTEVAKEIIFLNSPGECRFLNISLANTNNEVFVEKLSKLWKSVDDVHELRGALYDDQLKEAYSGLNATINLSGFLAVLAIAISSLGLMGMVIFSTQVRQKEIGIRKVLGASSLRLTFLLGKQFIILLTIASIAGVALTAFVFTKFMFTSIPNHAPLNLFEMIIGAMVVVALAIIIVGSQTIKISNTNPTEVLKTE